MFDEYTKKSLMYDFYGDLLTKRQQDVMNLYYEENLSLAEIGEEFNISRQGVHDTLKKAEEAISGYEDKLKLIDKFEKRKKNIDDIHDYIEKLLKRKDWCQVTELEKINDMIKGLEE